MRGRLYRKTVLCCVMIGLGLSLSLCVSTSLLSVYGYLYRCEFRPPPSLTLYSPFPSCYYTAHTTTTYRTGEGGDFFLSAFYFFFSLPFGLFSGFG